MSSPQLDALALQYLEQGCPRLPQSTYRQTSPRTKRYNCIAWAAGDSTRWWWPPHPLVGGSHWPDGLPGDVTLENFERAYETLGYRRCHGPELEDGLEKVAVYALNGTPTHAARQLASGRWTSKCGESFDIEHPLAEDVGGGVYGEVAFYMSRPSTSA